MQYKVTLAMPIYNVERYVERALLSALNQSFDSIEYILVDDKGTDNSINIVKEIIKDHPRDKDVRIIDHESNIGLGGTRNTAIDNAQGKFLYFMDSDDEITPDCISVLYKAMMETPVDFVAASDKIIFSDNKPEEIRIYQDVLIDTSKFAVANAYYIEKIPIRVYTWNKLYNVSFLRENNIRCIPHHLGEDVYFTFQVILNAGSCRLLANITYIYYIGVFSSSHWRTSLRWCKEVEELAGLLPKYAQTYKKCYFYPQLILRIYSNVLSDVVFIYDSKKISWNDKYFSIKQMIKYPLSLKEILTLNQSGPNFLRYLFSKIPSICFKILLLKFMKKLRQF
jgi:glycosyltransferase involved in cell wall biosynthesis